jgi:trimethyllysine dioxygenase
MCGAYIGVDEYRSRLAVLSEKWGNDRAGLGVGVDNKERSVWNPAL